MFSIFEYFNKSILYLREWYLAFIDYKWTKTITKDGVQYIKDEGEGKLDLQQYFGQGLWFNGIDHYLNNVGQTGIRNNTGTFMLSVSNITSSSSLKVFGGSSSHRAWIGNRNGNLEIGIGELSGVIVCPLESVMQVILSYDNFNYEVYVNNQLKKIGTYTVAITENRPIEIGGLSNSFYVSAAIKDVYYFRKSLSETERSNYFNQPNQFFMDSLEDNSCVLAMPMCEKDNFVRNYKSYSEGSNLVANGEFSDLEKWSVSPQSSISNGVANIKSTDGSFQYIRQLINGIANKSILLLKVEILRVGSGQLKAAFMGEGVNFFIPSTIGTHHIIITKGSFSTATLEIGRVSGVTDIDIDNVSIRELSSIYPITNYLSTCRTNAQRLPYGLQTSGFKRDNLGRILNKSNFLEGDGVGYGNTGYISPLAVVPESFEFIIEKPKVVQSSFCKYICGGSSSGDMTVEISSNTDTNGYVRFRKVGRNFGSNQWLSTNTMLITLVCDGTNVLIYFNGVLSGTYLAQPYTVSKPIKLIAEHAMNGSIVDNRSINLGALRLAIAYKKALTQKEVTDNFNKYDKLGLFTESGLPPEPIVPNNALVDENGNYILDENNNFIIVE